VANSNFVVHNGLTVGPLTINAATGDITTSGNITVTGSISSAGNILVDGSFIDSGTPGATLDDATALAIALGG
jgi:hypothetical protein